jgi:hypothetical protein
MVNPNEVIPNEVELNNTPFDGDDPICCCGSALTTETEQLNSVCLVCMTDEEREAKLDALDDMIAACRSVLSMSDVIAEDIRPDYRCGWERTSHRLCVALRMARNL